MERFIVIKTPLFEERLQTLNRTGKDRVAKLLDQLVENGNLIGKPLGYSFFREKKYNGNRLYYLIYEEWNAILVVTLGDKKEQPETIAAIRENLPTYKEYLRQRLLELKLI